MKRFGTGFDALARERRWFVVWCLAGIGVLSWLAVPGPRAARAALRLAENHAAGKAAGTADYVAYWIPKAAMGGAILAFLMLLATRYLVLPVPVRTAPALPRPVPLQGRLLAAFTALVMIFSGIANAPRLDMSLWGDEAATVRKTVVGQFERNGAGAMEWEQPSWLETTFRYRDPNNHPLNSVVSRWAHDAFARDLTRPDGFYFDERAMRLPVFAAGLLGLAALAWVGWVLGRPLAGAAAVILMAMHPWFVRYGVETRGYGFLLLFIPVAIGCLVKGVQTGRWRWWAGYGISQFLILWSYPGALHQLVALNISALCMVLALRGPSRGWRQAQAGRWFTACALGAVLSVLLLSPLVQPLMFYLKSDRMQGPMPPEWYGDAISWLVTGIPYRPWDDANPLCWSWLEAAAPGWRHFGTGLMVAVGVLGAAGWWSRGGVHRALLPALVLHAPLFMLQSHLTGGFVYTWYLLPALPGVLLLFCGAALLPLRQGAPIFLLFVWIGFLMIHTHKAVDLLRAYPTEPTREATRLTRNITLPSDPRIDEVITVEIVMQTRTYDPAARPLTADDPAEFKKHMAAADAAGKPLFVQFGSPGFADAVRPQVMAIVRNKEFFEKVADLPGMDAPYTRQVFRYRPGSLSGR